MHNAPSVVFPVGRCAFQAWLLGALGAVSAAVGMLFLIESDLRTFGVRGWLPCVAGVVGWLIWATWAFLSWLRSPQGTLRWEPWRVEEGGASGVWSWTDHAGAEPQVLSGMERVLDFQSRVLLRFCEPGRGQRWVWVERGAFPARWNDLRRALVASRA